MSAVPAPKYINVEDYLLMEGESEVKHEYYQGEMFAVAGGTDSHNRIVRNTLTAIDNFLAGKECEVFPSDLKVHSVANSLFTYPDLSIVCGPLDYWKNRRDIITNPVVLIEVLSKKTQAYDRGDKFKLYRTIPTVREYILISSLEVLVERYTKQPGSFWNFQETANGEDAFQIESIAFSCAVKDLYRNVSFESLD